MNNCATCRWWVNPCPDGDISDCMVFPTHIETEYDHGCGQWKKKDEPSEAFFAALGEIFTPPTDEQRAQAEQVLRELLVGWRSAA